MRRITIIALALSAAASAQAREIEKLDVMGENYPRAFFFRASEGTMGARYRNYEVWEKNFNRLSGIMGKCLDEEVPGRETQNPEYFTRFKKNHPTQTVLLHFNGNARDPRYLTGKYFPGHWVYRRPAVILSDIPAANGETDIKVDNAALFRDVCGRYQTSKDDIALFGITADGKHDWNHCEQVQLVSRDLKEGTIRVRRGCYGTKPLRFTAQEARAAAHRVEGPWGRKSNLMWFYNYMPDCPQDANGKTCTDHLVDDLAEWFGPGGKLAAFDGLEFDVLHHVVRGDTDGDGLEDNGNRDGINQYGNGVFRFLEALRERMGDPFVIQADGALGRVGERSQRGWGLINGIESEGFPHLRDFEVDDWSGGLNRHFFWRENARKPVFNYVNHKWNEPAPGEPGRHKHPDVPFSRHRLALAACQFFDAAVCYSFPPKNDAGGLFGVWDELRCGTANKLGWLGRPEGEAVQLAAKKANPAKSAKVEAVASKDGVTRFAVKGVSVDGSDLFVTVTMKGDPLTGCPPDMARFATVGLSGGAIDLLREAPVETGMKLRGSVPESDVDRDSGARVSIARETIDGTTLGSARIHPPYRGGKGYVYWAQDANIPKDAALSFSLGMARLSPERSDGIWFKVFVAELTDGIAGEYRKIFEESTNAHEWLPRRVDLAPYAGKTVRLKFVGDCGPKNNATTDQGSWGNVQILTGGIDESGITPYTEYMTWVNGRFFRSTFQFRDIRSNKVDLLLNIEGPEPVEIQSVTAHAHPNAVARVFENGLVLANPNRAPYTFDLNTISPGRKYRRFKATRNQDGATNNGQAVGKTVTLGERDALFLVRVR